MSNSIRMKEKVTLEDVKAVKGVRGAQKLFDKFDPPIDYGVVLDKQKLLLELAVKKCSGIGNVKNVDALGNLMQRKRNEDDAQRKELTELFIAFRHILANVDKEFRKHFERKEGPRLEDEIAKYVDKLGTPSNKLIVAGQTSAGKSTLLNIFLKEPDNNQQEVLLPSQMLSTTATICEIQYGEKSQAFIVERNKEIPIEFEDRNAYIYKDQREKLFDHDAVRLKLPSFILKSGVKLVDTPGVSENNTMSSVLKQYVRDNDPFGFIFVIDSSRAGGVLPNFLRMLTELADAEYVDNFGLPKFDPRSCIFVANQWDRIVEIDKKRAKAQSLNKEDPTNDEPSEQESTKAHISETLLNLPCMKSFNPRKQIFYLDAKFAYHARKEGLISDDFSALVDGLEKFIFYEQKRKIWRTYNWLEYTLNRAFHPLRSYIKRSQQSQKQRKDRKSEVNKVLDETEKEFKTIAADAREMWDNSVKTCSGLLLEFMKNQETKKLVASWTSKAMPKHDYDDDWTLIELTLDEAIDARVSEILKDWESDNKYISKAEGQLMEAYNLKKNEIAKKVELVELSLRNDHKDRSFEIATATEVKGMSSVLREKSFVDATPSGLRRSRSFTDLQYEKEVPEDSEDGTRDFKVKYGKTYGYDIMANVPEVQKVEDSFSKGPVMRVKKKLNKMHKKAKSASDMIYAKPAGAAGGEKYNSGFEDFIKDKVQYMRERSARIFEEMCNDGYVVSLVTEQLSKVSDYIQVTENEILKMIKTNRKLLDYIEKEKKDSKDILNHYLPLQDQVLNLLDKVVLFEKRHLAEANYKPDHIVVDEEQSRHHSLFATFYPGHMSDEFVRKHARGSSRRFDVILKKVHYIRPSVMKQHEKYLRKFNDKGKKTSGVARFLGTYCWKGDMLYVLNHNLITARSFFFNATRTFNTSQAEYFLPQLALALDAIHLKRLVHMEVSLDSVLLDVKDNKQFTVELSNLSESSSLTLPTNSNRIPLSEFLYLPPEVLHERGPYTQAGDVFGLGVIMLELCAKADIFQQHKENTTLKNWIEEKDQGHCLLKLAKEASKQAAIKYNEDAFRLAEKCLDKDPEKRISLAAWHLKWTELLTI